MKTFIHLEILSRFAYYFQLFISTSITKLLSKLKLYLKKKMFYFSNTLKTKYKQMYMCTISNI